MSSDEIIERKLNMKLNMKLVEFFNSLQGEGNSQGVNALFIRFPGCNLRCRSCDSTFSWKNIKTTDVDNSVIRNAMVKTDLVVFTGGEPLLKGNFKHIQFIIGMDPYKRYEIETNGTIPLDLSQWCNSIERFVTNGSRWSQEEPLTKNMRIQLNISPKDNFEQEKDLNTTPILIPQIQAFNARFPNITYIVKYLFNSKEDIEHIERQVEFYSIPRHLVWLQPKATMADDVISIIKEHFDDIVEHGWNISMRSHVLLFNDKKGV